MRTFDVQAVEIRAPRGTEAIDFATAPSSFQDARAMVRSVDEARRALQVHRTSRPRASSIDFARRLIQTLDSRPDA